MKIRFHSLFCQIGLQDFRIGSSDRLSGEPFHPLVIFVFRDRERKTAFAESQAFDQLGLLPFLHIFVFAYDTYVGNAIGNGLWNIVIAQE